MTFADVLRPAIPRRGLGLLYDAVLVMGGSALVAVLAQVVIPLPFSPVPLSGQTFAVLLVGMLLGSARGGLAVLLYLAEGAVGLPVFAGGGAGLIRLAGPTGGYLVGFLLAAFVVGFLAERGWDRSVWRASLAMLVGNALIYAAGLAWLSHFVGAQKVFALGFYPFILGDCIKLVAAALALPASWKLLHRFGGK